MARPGTWGFDPDDDFEITDGIEDVEVLHQDEAGVFADPVPARAVREVPNRGRTAGVVTCDILWHVSTTGLEHPIRPGDKITDSEGVSWIVDRADLAGASDQWRCETIRDPANDQESDPVPEN